MVNKWCCDKIIFPVNNNVALSRKIAEMYQQAKL